jgi:hypothetical protein
MSDTSDVSEGPDRTVGSSEFSGVMLRMIAPSIGAEMQFASAQRVSRYPFCLISLSQDIAQVR